MNYIDILNNSKVVENYNKIDEINPYPFNHGLKHVKNVCKIMDKLCDSLSISGKKKEALLIAFFQMMTISCQLTKKKNLGIS